MNETLQNIRQLRSVRSFTNKQIDPRDLDTILESSIRTSNASARQAYSIIVLTDAEKIKAVCGYTGAAALVYCADNNRLLDIADYLKQDYEISPTFDFITNSTDAILAAQTAVIAAKSLGIDSLITNGVHRQSFEKIYDLMKLPSDYCFPLIAVVLGYAQDNDGSNQSEKGRLKTGVIHFDEYHHLSPQEMDEEIRLFDSGESQFGLASPAQWQAMGYKHYYEWFFQTWIGKREDTFLPIIREHKFLI